MPAWSWRAAFILGGMIGLFGVFYRKNLLESPEFKQTDLKQHRFADLIKQHPQELLAGVFIGGTATIPITTVLVFINPVMAAKGYFDHHQIMLMQTALLFLGIACLIPAGMFADKKSPSYVMKLSCIALVVFSYPLMAMVDSGSRFGFYVALGALIVINELFLGPSNAYLKNLFKMEYRYRGSSVSFCLGMSLVGRGKATIHD